MEHWRKVLLQQLAVVQATPSATATNDAELMAALFALQDDVNERKLSAKNSSSRCYESSSSPRAADSLLARAAVFNNSREPSPFDSRALPGGISSTSHDGATDCRSTALFDPLPSPLAVCEPNNIPGPGMHSTGASFENLSHSEQPSDRATALAQIDYGHAGSILGVPVPLQYYSTPREVLQHREPSFNPASVPPWRELTAKGFSAAHEFAQPSDGTSSSALTTDASMTVGESGAIHRPEVGNSFAFEHFNQAVTHGNSRSSPSPPRARRQHVNSRDSRPSRRSPSPPLHAHHAFDRPRDPRRNSRSRSPVDSRKSGRFDWFPDEKSKRRNARSHSPPFVRDAPPGDADATLTLSSLMMRSEPPVVTGAVDEVSRRGFSFIRIDPEYVDRYQSLWTPKMRSYGRSQGVRLFVYDTRFAVGSRVQCQVIPSSSYAGELMGQRIRVLST